MHPDDTPASLTKKLQALLRASRDVVMFLDPQGHVTVTNDARLRFPDFARLAQQAGSLEGLARVYQVRRPGDEEPLPLEEWPGSRVLRGESVEPTEYEVNLQASGAQVVLEISGEPVRDTQGRQQAVLIVRDLTAQRRSQAELAEREADLGRTIEALREAEAALRSSEKRFRQLADAMPQLVWTAMPDGVVDYYNDRVREFMGIERRPDGNWTWSPVLHPDDEAPTVEAWQEAVRTGTVYEVAHRVRRADGVLRWYLGRGVPVRDDSGRIVRWYGTATDIHAQKEAEEALRRADARKDAFLAMLSHELRNPLTPIRTGVTLLRRTGSDTEQVERAVDLIDRQAAHLTRLVDDLLDVTRIARGKVRLQRQTVDLAELVGTAVEDQRDVFAEKGIQLKLAIEQSPLTAEADRARLLQVVGNLLDNAAKFTSEGGRVDVHLRAGEGGRAELRVRDNGAGMTAETLERLFEPFEQADTSLDRSGGGLGLGLALVKSLVEMHGGTVEARSEGPGRGAEFAVRLPLAEEAAEAEAAEAEAPRPTPPSPHRRVLIVEDVVDTAESLRDILELEGHTAEVAFHGQQGLEKAHTFGPDVVLCDLGLPGLDGYQVARALRNDPVTRDALLVALSGYASPDDVARSQAAGFDHHLSKPPDLSALYRILEEAPRRETPPASGPTASTRP